MSLVTQDVTLKGYGSNRLSTVGINLPKHDTDIEITLPNGERISLQWRVEAVSLDVCLPENLTVTTWEGDDMQPSKPFQGKSAAERKAFADGHVRVAKQLVIDLGPNYLEAK